MIGRVSDVDLRLIRVFLVVVEAGGFALATAQLNVAESTISQHMSDLEKRLGLRLCERGRSGFRLTQQGEEFHLHAVAMMTELESFRNQVARMSRPAAKELRIGLPDSVLSIANEWLPRTFAQLQKRHNLLHPNLSIMSPRNLERAVIEERVDCAIAPEHRRVAGLDYTELLSERNVLYCGSGHAFFAYCPGGVADEDIESAGRISRGYLERFDASFFRNDTYAATVTETEAAAILIKSGHYLGFLPDHYAAPFVLKDEMRPVDPQKYSFDVMFHLITRRASAKDPLIQSFLACLRAATAVPVTVGASRRH